MGSRYERNGAGSEIKLTYREVASVRKATVLETKVLCLTFILPVDISLSPRNSWGNNLQCKGLSPPHLPVVGAKVFIMACFHENVTTHRRPACQLAQIQIINNFHFNRNIKQTRLSMS